MEKKNSHPNILFIMADQFRSDVMSCVGGSAQTPNLDALAAEGVGFTNCCTVAPLCVPARISMMTGKHPHTTGVWDNADYALSPEANLWTKVIHAQGYGSGLFGKTHLHTDFGDMISREPIVQGYGFDTVNEVSGPHSTCQTRTHMSEEWKAKGVWEAYCADMLNRTKVPCAKPSPLPLEDYYDVYVGRKGREFLEQYHEDKPWFCHVSFGGPHEPWDTPEPYASMYRPEDMPAPLPHIQESTADRPRGEYDRIYAKKEIRCSEETAGEIRANYCGGVTLIDKMIGEIIDTIKKRGEWENTVVLFTSDHGEMNGDHGFVNKRNFLRPSLNIPLILRTPETAKKGGSVSNALVSLLDIGPTLAELAGGTLEYAQCGKSLCPVLEGAAEHRSYILSEYAGEIMYMDREWKMVTNKAGEPYLLFDMQNDPQELQNLIGAPEYETVVVTLERKLMRAIAENRCLKPSLTQMPTPRFGQEFSRIGAAE